MVNFSHLSDAQLYWCTNTGRNDVPTEVRNIKLKLKSVLKSSIQLSWWKPDCRLMGFKLEKCCFKVSSRFVFAFHAKGNYQNMFDHNFGLNQKKVPIGSVKFDLTTFKLSAFHPSVIRHLILSIRCGDQKGPGFETRKCNM